VPLRCEPVLERGGVGYAEAFEEVSRDQAGRSFPLRRAFRLVEGVGVQGEAVGRESDLIALGPNDVLTKRAPQHAHRLAQ
jgi:hypothetical protein